MITTIDIKHRIKILTLKGKTYDYMRVQ